MTPPMERIQVLDSIEKDIVTCLHSAEKFIAYRRLKCQAAMKDSLQTDMLFSFIQLLYLKCQAFLELSKEKSSLKQAEGHTHQFLKTLSHVESKLTEQINYLTQVSTGQPHEGSGYASQKVLQMAWHRLEHARSRVSELDRIRVKHLQGRPAARPANAGTPTTSQPTTAPTST